MLIINEQVWNDVATDVASHGLCQLHYLLNIRIEEAAELYNCYLSLPIALFNSRNQRYLKEIGLEFGRLIHSHSTSNCLQINQPKKDLRPKLKTAKMHVLPCP